MLLSRTSVSSTLLLPLLLAASLSPSSHVGAVRTYTVSSTEYGSTPYRVPDPGARGIEVHVPHGDGCYLKHVVVKVTLTHTWAGDLSLTITHPNGECVGLMDRIGTLEYSGDNTTMWNETELVYTGDEGRDFYGTVITFDDNSWNDPNLIGTPQWTEEILTAMGISDEPEPESESQSEPEPESSTTTGSAQQDPIIASTEASSCGFVPSQDPPGIFTLSDLKNLEPDGMWTFKAEDHAEGDEGFVEDVTLILKVECTACVGPCGK